MAPVPDRGINYHRSRPGHRGGLFRFIVRQCSLRSQAEELFQEVWMNLIQARSRYRVDAQFRTYLYTLAHNRLIDYFRRHKVVHRIVPRGRAKAA